MTAPDPTPEPIAPPAAAPSALALATQLVCGFEAFRASPYRDTAGVFTIGYGSTRIDGTPVTGDTAPITEAEALDDREDTSTPSPAAQLGKLGGAARAKALTPQRRAEIAKGII